MENLSELIEELRYDNNSFFLGESSNGISYSFLIPVNPPFAKALHKIDPLAYSWPLISSCGRLSFIYFPYFHQ